MCRLAVRDKQTRFIHNFLKSRDSCLASVFEQLRTFSHERTNRVGRFFGSVKYGMNHQIHHLIDTAGLVKSLPEISLAYLFHIINNVEIPLEVLASDNIQHISRGCLLCIHKQCDFAQQANVFRSLYADYYCKFLSHFELPLTT
jgi:hypothetical protein